MSSCTCHNLEGAFAPGIRVTSASCPTHGVKQRPAVSPVIPLPAPDIAQPETDGEVVLYKVWVEVERSIYDHTTGDERAYEDMGFDLLSGSHIAEFMADDASPEAEQLAQTWVTRFGEAVQSYAQVRRDEFEAGLRDAQAARDALGEGGG